MISKIYFCWIELSYSYSFKNLILKLFDELLEPIDSFSTPNLNHSGFTRNISEISLSFSWVGIDLRPKTSEQRNFIRLGSKSVLQKPAISRLGTKSEKVRRFWDKRGLRGLSRPDAGAPGQEPKAKSPAGCGAWGCLKACWAGLRSLYWRCDRD